MASSSFDKNQKLCYCGMPARMGRSRTSNNPGRLFWGCRRWKTADCRYFEWVTDDQRVEDEQTVESLGSAAITSQQHIAARLIHDEDQKKNQVMLNKEIQNIHLLYFVVGVIFGFILGRL